jgi:glutamate-1-semialdehyde 2,1-aminomutase
VTFGKVMGGGFPAAAFGGRADVIKTAVSDALSLSGVDHVVQATGTMFSVFLTDRAVRDFDDARRTDSAAYAAFFHAMLDRGVHLPPSAYEAWFLSAAHDDRAVQAVLDALPEAARAAAAAQDHQETQDR